jgi:hypothetical protein
MSGDHIKIITLSRECCFDVPVGLVRDQPLQYDSAEIVLFKYLLVYADFRLPRRPESSRDFLAMTLTYIYLKLPTPHPVSSTGQA